MLLVVFVVTVTSDLVHVEKRLFHFLKIHSYIGNALLQEVQDRIDLRVWILLLIHSLHGVLDEPGNEEFIICLNFLVPIYRLIDVYLAHTIK